MHDRSELVAAATAILKENDRGSYTVPTRGLYPFQWNWDSCLSALGLARLDEGRAFTEIETLFAHQWPDGMVPHIIFHVEDDGYFPGPNVWQTGRPVPTSGITQPAVAGFALRRLVERARDRTEAERRALALLEPIHRWHEWFFAMRDPAREGLVAILHPWESGRDNSVDWDLAFERVPTSGITPYTRRDLAHADASMRPTKEQYDRYLWLVERFRSLGWDNAKLHDASPFQIVDPGLNAILLRSCLDLAALAEGLGAGEIAARNRAWAKAGLAAMEGLWSDRLGQYLCRDRVTGTLVDSASVGGLIAAFAPLPPARLRTMARRIETLAARCRYVVPSHDPADPRYDARRYWRGPVWLIVNYMISDGLEGVAPSVAERIREASLELIGTGGFAEYYDPNTGAPCGGGRFTWTAAMVLEFLAQAEAAGTEA
ncbi:MGH1-like glycoside hydrolase domain-containing protein [Solirhodobacter olei]|uniref:MGH1-like glycoside hydrolase domain-containing protein n=1 Tax=Solirhodobacter olei TaxID=2493082 RepID=UPI000FD9489D|nr:hypothetical protein [Solirhodobacter olei]